MKYDEKGLNVLDGSQTHKEVVTPFDAHEQATRNQEPVPFQEYPKAIDHDENGEPIIALNAKHEEELKGGE